jgi:hypothetical protein
VNLLPTAVRDYWLSVHSCVCDRLNCLKTDVTATVFLSVCYLTMLPVVIIMNKSVWSKSGMILTGQKWSTRSKARPSATLSTRQHYNKRTHGNKQCLNVCLHDAEHYDSHRQFQIQFTLLNTAFYCDLTNARPLPRCFRCDKRTVVRKSPINLLFLYKHTITCICSQLVYILEDICQLMYFNRRRHESRLTRLIINLLKPSGNFTYDQV